MATRFTASDARNKVDSARKSLSDKNKHTKLVRFGFKQQRLKVISAAIDGKNEIEVESIYLFKNLIQLNIEVIEVDNWDECEKNYKNLMYDEIINLFELFIEDSKRELKYYYYGEARFRQLNLEALRNAIESTRLCDFLGDEEFANIPSSIQSKYLNYFKKINSKIIEYKKIINNSEYPEWQREFSEFNNSGLLHNGHYRYSEDDRDVDLLEPSRKENKLIIKWGSVSKIKYMNESLLSNEGLAWLSSNVGQKLVKSIFDSINDVAQVGKSSLKLSFSLSKDGWSFIYRNRKIVSCMPDEIIEIIAGQKFNIDDTKSTSDSYSIYVSW